MKGNEKVIEALNTLLRSELTAMDQYLVHSKIYEDQGLSKLHARIAHEFDDEKGHAELLIERILFLEGKPDVSKRDALNIGSCVESMLASDLEIEYHVAESLRTVITLCEQAQDYNSRKMLLTLLEDTESDHMFWLEQQLRLIKTLGLENYVQSQM